MSLTSCSVESIDNENQLLNATVETSESSLICTGANPQARLVNNGSVAFNFVIMSSGGNVIQISNVMPNTTTNWSSFSQGDTLFSIVSSATGASDIKVGFTMNECTELNLEIDSNNLLVDSQPIDL